MHYENVQQKAFNLSEVTKKIKIDGLLMHYISEKFQNISDPFMSHYMNIHDFLAEPLI